MLESNGDPGTGSPMFRIRTVESGSMCCIRNQICLPNQNVMYIPALNLRVDQKGWLTRMADPGSN